jgi:hypothetical protein
VRNFHSIERVSLGNMPALGICGLAREAEDQRNS